MKKLVILLGLGFGTNALSAIHCHTPHGQKDFVIDNQKVSFLLGDEEESMVRNLASIENVQNSDQGQSISRTLNFEGNKHIIFIKDSSHFSEQDDYIILRSAKGHEILYPLNCQ